MQPDEARRADARAAAIDFAAEPPLLENVLFHCQQTVEKAFPVSNERIRSAATR